MAIMSFEEFILNEAFNIGPRVMKSSPKLNKQNMVDHYGVTYSSRAVNIVENIYKQYDEVKTFLVTYTHKYIIILLRKGNDVEVHFSLFGKPDEHGEVNNNNNPIGLFQKVFDVVYWEGVKSGRKIQIDFPEDRLNFYKKLIDIVMKKHDLSYTVNVTKTSLILKPPRNYKLEKMQEFYKGT